MNSRWEILYREMVNDIERCWELLLPESEQAECAFKIANNYWQKVKDQLKNNEFKNIEEEIDFYKNVKPKFTGQIEFFTMRYLGTLFIPDKKEIEINFWQQEEKKLERFIAKNLEFVNYYNSKCTYRDEEYFSPLNRDEGKITVSKVYDLDGEFMSAYDHKVATLLAQEMYHEYVKEKLDRLL